MLRVIFEQHPEMAVPPESYFPISFWRKRARYARGARTDLSVLAEDLLAHDRFQRWQLDPGLVRERLKGVEPIDFPEAIRRVYALYAEVHGKVRYGDKTPPFLMHMRTLSDLFPESRFIHLVRDGRDVVLSLREWPFGPRTFSAGARYWSDRVRRARAAGQRLGRDRYVEVRYEELVADPEAVLKDLCAFVELDFRPEMLAYREEALAAIPMSGRRRGRASTLPPTTTGARDWRREMNDRQLAVVEAIAGEQLEAFGYEPGLRRVPPTAKAVAAVTGLPARVRRRGRRVKRTTRPGARSRREGTGR